MKRVAKFLKELWVGPGGLLVAVPCGLAFVLFVVGGLGYLTLDFLCIRRK
ncbi:hypothetical protein LCGC14_2895550 [marine sediment metagenome]|uniref:Uncharacterized protein n=1 Tax=marine sediment metagenome TaxID=412755 RepID=A0A0F9A3T1_9ZZZZ